MSDERTARVAAYGGALACVVVLATMAVPYALSIPNVGERVAEYYAFGPVGATGIAFLSLIDVVVFLAGERGNADRRTAAGIAAALGIGLVVLALSWALAVDGEFVRVFGETWMRRHRWAVVGATALVALAAGAYARAVLR